VAWAWNVSQGEIGMQTFQDLQENSERVLQEAIQNPNLDEETKTELKKALEESRQAYSKNKKYADLSMEIVRPLTNKEDMQLIKKYHKELFESYTGMPYSDLNIPIDWSQFQIPVED
jgi:molecular chaperone DnaK (HSP70)